MATKIGVIGSGEVGVVLANGFFRDGYDVMIGTNTPSKSPDLFKKTYNKVHVGSFQETAAFGEIVVLAVKGSVAEQIVTSLGNRLDGKTVIDTTNPITDAPPVNGVLQYFISMNTSLMERLQAIAPNAKFIKAFSCVGSDSMIDPDFNGLKPTMFVCGNNTDSRNAVISILKKFGWEIEDMGMAEAARAIEPLAMLWCIPGFRSNSWDHAFKLLKK